VRKALQISKTALPTAELGLTRQEKSIVRSLLKQERNESPCLIIKAKNSDDSSGFSGQQVELVLCWGSFWRDRASAKGSEGIVSSADAGNVVNSLNQIGEESYRFEAYEESL
jgi:hypothetical protein